MSSHCSAIASLPRHPMPHMATSHVLAPRCEARRQAPCCAMTAGDPHRRSTGPWPFATRFPWTPQAMTPSLEVECVLQRWHIVADDEHRAPCKTLLPDHHANEQCQNFPESMMPCLARLDPNRLTSLLSQTVHQYSTMTPWCRIDAPPPQGLVSTWNTTPFNVVIGRAM